MNNQYQNMKEAFAFFLLSREVDFRLIAKAIEHKESINNFVQLYNAGTYLYEIEPTIPESLNMKLWLDYVDDCDQGGVMENVAAIEAKYGLD
jgi:hypothetical protein